MKFRFNWIVLSFMGTVLGPNFVSGYDVDHVTVVEKSSTTDGQGEICRGAQGKKKCAAEAVQSKVQRAKERFETRAQFQGKHQ